MYECSAFRLAERVSGRATLVCCDGRKAELLAPAGNFESLRAAVVNGADAVYLGASAFSARAKAGNFTKEELLFAVEYCHTFGVKVYLAVNTLIKPSEYDEALAVVSSANEIGVDAVILQDLAFLNKLHSIMPDIIIHLSTQAGIHNVEGALIAEKLGATRIILSREATISDIEQICKKTNLEVEVFIHGALCVAFSGNCYFSSLATGLSGNRGRCLQLCRKKYYAGDKSGYFLSAKDLNLSKRIDMLLRIGVTSFKIEGRMRRPEYVAEAVKYYRALISGKTCDDFNLRKQFNRGDFCEGYLLEPTANVIHHKVQGHVGVVIGKVKDASRGRALLLLDKKLNAGDGLKFLRDGIEVGSSLVSADGFEVGYVGNVKKGDTVCITSDSVLNREILQRDRKLLVDIFLTVKVDEPIEARVLCGDSTFTVLSDFNVDLAEKKPMSIDDFKLCFNKTGDTEFSLNDFGCDIDGNVFCRLSNLNDFRRSIYVRLKRELLNDYKKMKRPKMEICKCNVADVVRGSVFSKEDVIFQTDDLLLLKEFSDVVRAVAYFPKAFDDVAARDFLECSIEKYLTLPFLLRGNDIKVIRKFIENAGVKRVIVNNISHFEIAKDCEKLLGIGMNVINPRFGGDKILSLEYDGKDFGDNYAYVYGKAPLMTFAHCPKKTLNNGVCEKCNGEDISFADEKGNSFNIRFYRVGSCYAQMLNVLPINAFDKAKKMGISRFFVDLIGCTNEEKFQILEAFRLGKFPIGNATGGFFSKKLS